MESAVKVGDKLWYQPDGRTSTEKLGSEMTITGIGRVWVTMSRGHRFKKDDERMAVDGGQYSSPGRFFLSQDHYRADRDLDRAWDWFRRQVGYGFTRPDGLTLIETTGICRTGLARALKGLVDKGFLRRIPAGTIRFQVIERPNVTNPKGEKNDMRDRP